MPIAGAASSSRERENGMHAGRLAVWMASGVLAACASTGQSDAGRLGAGAGAAGEDPTQMSAECRAAGLRPPPPMAASAIPDEVLRRRQSGYATVRYDLVQGQPQNPRVVASQPPGLYDPYALRHALAQADPGGHSVRGCILTVNIQF